MARENMARSVDKPPSFIVPDATLLQLAKHPPQSLNELRSTRGLPSISNTQSNELLAALERAANLPPEAFPERTFAERPDSRVESVAALLGIVAQMRASQHDISRSYLASREQLTALSAWWLNHERDEQNEDAAPPDLAILHDWRHELLGAELLQFLAGRLALTLDETARAAPDEPIIRVTSFSKDAELLD